MLMIKLIFFTTTIFQSLLTLQASSNACENPVFCPPFNSTPSFPFSFVPGCGHPLFQLKCHDEAAIKTATISINNISYSLVSYTPNVTALTITPTSTATATQRRAQENCTWLPTLSTLNNSQISFSKPFHVSGSSCSRLSALRPCPHQTLPNCTLCSWQCNLISSPTYLIDQCNSSAWRSSGDYKPSCQGDVLGVLDGVLRLGFEVNWDEDDGEDAYFSGCSSCRAKNGLCGFNSSHPDKPFLCLPSQAGIVIEEKTVNRLSVLWVIFFSLVFFIALSASIVVVRCKRRAKQGADVDPTMVYLQRHRLNSSLPPVFTYEELEASTNRFDPKRKLGDGGFGSVYLGKLNDGRLVAVKHLHKHNSAANSGGKGLSTKSFCNEILILSSINHPNLVKLHGYCSDPRGLLLVYDYVPNGTLADHLHGRKGALTWNTRLGIAIQTSMAIEYLHFTVVPPIVHRDITSSNIFVEKDMRVKLGDFGLSRLLVCSETTQMTVSNSSDGVWTGPQGTPGYLDPDYYQSFRLNEKSDVYSLGVVLLELITGMKAVDQNRGKMEMTLADMVVPKIQKGLLHEVVDSVLVVDSEAMEGVGAVAELAFRCLAADKDDRPDAKEVVAELRRIKGWGHGGVGGGVLRTSNSSNVIVPDRIVYS